LIVFFPEYLKNYNNFSMQGNTREVLHKFTVDLPKKHGRGGQSALRFARLRMEKRHNYVRKVAEVATQLYIANDKANIAGLILAGSADFKTELSQSDMFDPVSSFPTII
jgi:peptide chain release factor subunit 1